MKRVLLLIICVISSSAIYAQEALADQKPESATLHSPSPNSNHIKLQGYVNLGANFMLFGAGPTLDASVGMRIHDYLYIGAEAGFHTLLIPITFSFSEGEETTSAKATAYMLYVPLGANIKGYFTKGRKFTPYVNTSLGGFINVLDGSGAGYCQAGLSFDYRRFAFGIGYNAMFNSDTAIHLGYIKLGVRFGKEQREIRNCKDLKRFCKKLINVP